MNDYILERISETIFSSGKLSVTIYSLLNDKGSNDGRAYPSTTLNLYNSSKYSNLLISLASKSSLFISIALIPLLLYVE